MKWSISLGEFAGIKVHVHLTFFLLLGFVGFSYWIEKPDILFMLSGISFILLIFLCVVLHEYGHALTARRFGVKTKDITLLPIGGVARLEEIPNNPVQELWIAIAGPAVNVVISIGLLGILLVNHTLVPVSEWTLSTGSFLQRLLVINLFLVGFNLIPAFPMDGGRILRALLAIRMDYARATQFAVYIGQGLAFMMGFIGLFTNPFLLFIAAFVWIGATSENNMVQMKSSLDGVPVSRIMYRDYKSLAPNDVLASAVAMILETSQQDFPVIQDQQLIGILTRTDLINGLSQRGRQSPVRESMQTEFPTIHLSEMLDAAFQKMQASPSPTLPVLDDDKKLVGILTTENVGEFVMIQSAMNTTRNRA